MLADFNQPVSDGGAWEEYPEMVPGHHGGSTRTITGMGRGAPVLPSNLWVYTWSATSLLSPHLPPTPLICTDPGAFSLPV